MKRTYLAALGFLFACGGSISPVDPSTFQIEGSYDLYVQTVNVTVQQGQPVPPTDLHPAEGSHARVDIKKVSGVYEAAVTVDFGDPVPATIGATSDGAITLVLQSGGATFSGQSSGYQNVNDELSILMLKVGSNGKIGGAWSATGSEFISDGDVGWQEDLASTGTIGPDARPPQTSALVTTPSLSGNPLPWDALYVRASEPVDGSQLQNSTSLAGTSGPLSVAWSAQSNQPDWIGATLLTGYRTEWAQDAQALNVAAGVADPSANLSTSLVTPVSYVKVPLAGAFDATTMPASWGPVSVASGAGPCGSDGVSCLEIGPVTGPCQGTSAGGIAGRLNAAGHGSLSMKYRVRAASQYGQPYLMAPLGFTVAAPGAAPVDAPTPISPTLSASGDPTYPYASAWTTVTEALPPNTGEIGFAFAPFDQRASSYCGGGPAMAPVTLVVDVVQVTTSP